MENDDILDLKNLRKLVGILIHIKNKEENGENLGVPIDDLEFLIERINNTIERYDYVPVDNIKQY